MCAIQLVGHGLSLAILELGAEDAIRPGRPSNRPLQLTDLFRGHRSRARRSRSQSRERLPPDPGRGDRRKRFAELRMERVDRIRVRCVRRMVADQLRPLSPRLCISLRDGVRAPTVIRHQPKLSSKRLLLTDPPSSRALPAPPPGGPEATPD